uniref:RPB6 homolog n=1 Tax=Dermatophagoides pteronyssinus TaxID=6956 RepID=A0A6P6YC43_DERPT|nr:DNA-directed RNA polymerases I, II, and III subunit RPABC2-like [Dermatophagoides pteronyssinus]
MSENEILNNLSDADDFNSDFDNLSDASLNNQTNDDINSSIIFPAEDETNHRLNTRPAIGARKTSPYMTRFEKAKLIGTRALQISLGAPLTVQVDCESDPIILAERELIAKTIPFIVRRYLPNGEYEDWSVSELLLNN